MRDGWCCVRESRGRGWRHVPIDVRAVTGSTSSHRRRGYKGGAKDAGRGGERAVAGWRREGRRTIWGMGPSGCSTHLIEVSTYICTIKNSWFNLRKCSFIMASDERLTSLKWPLSAKRLYIYNSQANRFPNKQFVYKRTLQKRPPLYNHQNLDPQRWLL